MTTTTHVDDEITHWSWSFWLGHCEGFRVDSPDGRVGIVESVLGDEGEPTALVVREGLFAFHSVTVPIEDVAEMFPRAERIVLRSRPGPL